MQLFRARFGDIGAKYQKAKFQATLLQQGESLDDILYSIVINRETGLLHEAGNAEQLAQQVMQLDTDSETRRAMGQQGRVWLEQNADEAKWRVEFVKIATHALNAGR